MNKPTYQDYSTSKASFWHSVIIFTWKKFGGPEKDRFWGVCWGRWAERLALASGLLGLLGQEHSLDVGQYTSLGDGDAGQKFVQLLVVADGQLEMTGNDSGFLVITGGVACQLKNFSSQVLEDGSKVHWGTSTNSFGIVALPQQTVDTSDWELESGPRRSGLRLSLDFASLATSRHDDRFVV